MNKEFRQEARTGKTKRWVITVKGASVTIEHGLVDGKMQKTSRVCEAVNVGKANEKSAQQAAEEWAERQMLLRERKGYREVDPQTGEFWSEEATSEITFGDLPENLRFYKPLNSMNTYLQKMMDAGTAMWLRKRNGNMHIVEVDALNRCKMYSSTLQRHQKDEIYGPVLFDRYPHLLKEVKKLKLPPNTILLGELCTCAAGGFADVEEYDVDDLDYVNGIRGSLTPAAFTEQAEKGRLGLCIWDIAFWDGECVLKTIPIGKRIQRITDMLMSAGFKFLTFPETATVRGGCIDIDSPVKSFDIYLEGRKPEDVLMQLAKELQWEGWVVVDPSATYGDKSYNFRGKSERPKFCAKLKPKYEADFIIRWDPEKGIGRKGKGKKSVGVGSVQAYLMHPKRGEIPISLVGGGFDEKSVKELANPRLYPLVAQIEFGSWTKVGSLQFPEFVRVRDDKLPEECLVNQNPSWKKHYAEA